MWTCRIRNLRRNPVRWGSSAPRFEQEHFYQLSCHPHTTSVVCFMCTFSSLWDRLLCSSLEWQAEVQPRCCQHRVLWHFPVHWCDVLFPAPVLLCYLAEYTSRMWVNGAGMAQKIVSLVESLGFAGRVPVRCNFTLTFQSKLKGETSVCCKPLQPTRGCWGLPATVQISEQLARNSHLSTYSNDLLLLVLKLVVKTI